MSCANCVRWYFNCKQWLPVKEEFLLGMSSIQRSERDRIMRFVYKKDVKSALIGRLMIRRCLSNMLSIPDHKIELSRTERGKPILSSAWDIEREQHFTSDGRQFDFNLSHDGDYCVVAGEWSDKVGIDLSVVRDHGKPVAEYFQTMFKIFSPQEWLFINGASESGSSSASSDDSRLFRFHRLWALKESLVKAEGIGISYDLQRIRFSCNSCNLKPGSVVNDTRVFIDGKLRENWIFEESLLDNRSIVSLALNMSEKHLISDRKAGDTSNHHSWIVGRAFSDIIEPQVTIQVDDALWDEFTRKDEPYLGEKT